MKSTKKQLYTTVLGLGLLNVLSSCNDSFMDRFPETSITEKVFFQNPGDLESYTNGMYGYLGASYWDAVSDNMLYKESSSTYELLSGTARLKLGALGLGEISAKLILCLHVPEM